MNISFLLTDIISGLQLQLHSDVDKGDGKVKYVLSGEGSTSIFTIDENTGDIHATKRLDREEQAYYTLQAQAVDRITNIPVEPRSEFLVKVQDINDNEPKFMDGHYMAGVPEMSALGEPLSLQLPLFVCPLSSFLLYVVGLPLSLLISLYISCIYPP